MPFRTQRPTCARQSGFTLLEILVVVVIIGILVTFATLSIGNRALDDRMEMEAKRLNQILRAALEEAEIKGVELGFRHVEGGYEFLAVGEEGKWVVVEGGGILRRRTLGDPFFLELRIEGRAVPPASGMVVKTEDKDEPPLQPQVFLLSSGEVTAFTLELKAPRHRSYYHLDADALGRFTLERREEKS